MKILRVLLLTVFTILLASPSWAAIAHVQDCAAATITATSISCTLTSVAAGDVIVVNVHSGGTAPTVSDNNGGVYTINSVGNIYMAPGHAAGTTIVTATQTSANVNLTMNAAEFSGLGTAPTFDGNGSLTTYAASTTMQTGLITTSGTNPELLVCGAFVDSAAQTPSALIDYGAGGGTPNVYTNQGQSTAETIVGAWQSVATAGPFGCQWTVTSASNQGFAQAILPATPTISEISFCPSGTNGPCIFPATSVAGLAQQKCPSGYTCESIVINASAICSPGTVPTGGGSNICDVAWNGSVWVED